MTRVIVVTSGKGGVGKTTVTASLGIALGAIGAKVALVEGDIGLNNLDVALSVENRVVYDLSDVILSRCRLKQALITLQQSKNVDFLPSARVSGEAIGTKDFKQIINQLAEDRDFVLLDCPAGIDQGFYRAAQSASEAVIVTTPHISAVRDADKTAAMLARYGVAVTGIAVNRVRGDLLARGEIIRPQDIAKLLKIPLLAVLPEDDKMGAEGALSAQSSKDTVSAYTMFARLIAFNESAVFDPEKSHFGILNIRRRRV